MSEIDTSTAAIAALMDGVTAGPWRVEHETTLIWGHCDKDDSTYRGMGYPVAECRISPVSSWAHGPDADAGETNARFIAAARELVPALVAERDAAVVRAEALVAAAYEDAANELQRVVDDWECGHMESKLCDCAEYVAQWELAANTIRDIIVPTGAAAALDRLTAQALAQGMREAAEICRGLISAAGAAGLQERKDGMRDASDAILARAEEIEEEAHNEQL